MFSHIILDARNHDRQTAFHDAVLPHLGLIRRTDRAPSRAAVDAAWPAAIAAGGADEGAPALRPGYEPDYYGAYARDPEGDKLCFRHLDAFTEDPAQPQPSDAPLRPDPATGDER